MSAFFHHNILTKTMKPWTQWGLPWSLIPETPKRKQVTHLPWCVGQTTTKAPWLFQQDSQPACLWTLRIDKRVKKHLQVTSTGCFCFLSPKRLVASCNLWSYWSIAKICDLSYVTPWPKQLKRWLSVMGIPGVPSSSQVPRNFGSDMFFWLTLW